MPEHHLILGGARCGKTAFALKAAEALGERRTYIATGEAFDDEMAARIAAHKAERAAGWQTVEEPRALASAIRSATTCDVVLVDCLTLWLSNMMHHGQDLEAETAGLLSALVDAPVPVLLVSNEVGLSIVPENALARAFRDAQGRLNQAVAAAVPRATFVAAGLPLCLKTPG